MRLLNKLNTTNFFLCSFPSDSIKPVFFFAGDAPGWVKLLLTISNSIFALFLCYQSWSVSREESQYYRYISPWPVRDLFVTLSDSPLLYLVKRYSTCGAAFLFGQECKRIYMESRGLKLGVLGQLGRNLSSSSPVHFSTFVWSLYLSLTLCLLTPILLVSTFAYNSRRCRLVDLPYHLGSFRLMFTPLRFTLKSHILYKVQRLLKIALQCMIVLVCKAINYFFGTHLQPTHVWLLSKYVHAPWIWEIVFLRHDIPQR